MLLHRVSTSGTHLRANKILSSLPDAEYERLAPQLMPVVVEPRQILYRAGDPVTTVYFPTGGVFSITTSLADGSMVEAATVGDEGVVGIEAVLCGTPTATGNVMLQVPAVNTPDTQALTLSLTALRRELAHDGALQGQLGRYAQTVFGQTIQSLACNTLHNVEERCCRWLLMTHDRVRADEFSLSHEFLAIMLGTRRQTVTVVAGALQSAGFIRYKRGRITVLDREGLESGACECYAVARAQLDQLFAPTSVT